MTEEQIEKIVCDWSMRWGIAMTDVALQNLVDNILHGNVMSEKEKH